MEEYIEKTLYGWNETIGIWNVNEKVIHLANDYKNEHKKAIV